MPTFNATIALLGINPYVSVPGPVLKRLFVAAARNKSPIPVKVILNDTIFRQTLVRYRGDWRLYLNTPMRKAAQKQVGDRLKLNVEFDPGPRTEHMPGALQRALSNDAYAEQCFGKLRPSRRKEILCYLNKLRSRAALERNVQDVVAQLHADVSTSPSVSSRAPKLGRKSTRSTEPALTKPDAPMARAPKHGKKSPARQSQR